MTEINGFIAAQRANPCYPRPAREGTHAGEKV
jgi:hypothetical protein